MLSQFRTIDIIWNGINERINQKIELVQGGGGRVLSVQVLNGGQAVDTTGIDLSLKWKATNGLYEDKDEFTLIEETGKYELTPPKNMVRNTGSVRARLELSAKDEEPVVSMPFDIQIKEAI